MLPRLITRLVGWAVAIFYDVERTGPPLAEGPVLVAGNHTNALVDPLLIFHTAGRSTRPLAKAPLFEHPVVGMVLKGLGGLPVYRRQDDPALMHLNDRTFDAAVGALLEGGAVQIFPEGESHSEPALAPLRTGAARIALMAEERAGWTLGLRIQPVGLTFVRKHLFRGRAIAAYGEPVPVSDFRGAYESDQRAAARRLTDLVRERLERLTLNFERADDRQLIEVAERLYAREKGLARPRERETMANRLPRLQEFAAGLRWLRVADPERAEELRLGVSRYVRLLTLFGVTEGDVPTRYETRAVFGHALTQLAFLVLVLPAAVMGALFWAAPFYVTRVVSRRFPANLDQIATYKVSVALMSFPTWLAFCSGVLWFWVGWRMVTALLAVGPIVGLAAVAWRDRQGRVREDLRVFLRAVRRSQSRDRLAELRSALVAEFDALEELRRADRGSPRTPEGTG